MVNPLKSQKFQIEKGFTLIELLVVIALLSLGLTMGILVFRDHLHRARDARAKINMNQLRIEATKIFQEYGSYNPSIFCCGYPTDPDGGAHCKKEVKENCQEIADQLKVGPIIHTDGKKYCVYVKLKKGTYFCFDNTGTIGEFQKVNSCTGTSYSCQ